MVYRRYALDSFTRFCYRLTRSLSLIAPKLVRPSSKGRSLLWVGVISWPTQLFASIYLHHPSDKCSQRCTAGSCCVFQKCIASGPEVRVSGYYLGADLLNDAASLSYCHRIVGSGSVFCIYHTIRALECDCVVSKDVKNER